MTENPNHYCLCPIKTAVSDLDRTTLSNRRAAVLDETRWTTGDVITVRFLGGSQALQRRVRGVALEWTVFANVNFEFRTRGRTDIRIGFVEGDGSWSYLGKQCRTIHEPDPTMNYGWLTDASTDEEVRSVVLHEFGHALGLIHEHQNPRGAIPWNKRAVSRDLGGPPNNWDEQTIESNMFKFYDPGQVTASKVDPISIMMYPIPKSWTRNGFSAGFNSQLSATDKSLIKRVYPGRP